MRPPIMWIAVGFGAGVFAGLVPFLAGIGRGEWSCACSWEPPLLWRSAPVAGGVWLGDGRWARLGPGGGAPERAHVRCAVERETESGIVRSALGDCRTRWGSRRLGGWGCGGWVVWRRAADPLAEGARRRGRHGVGSRGAVVGRSRPRRARRAPGPAARRVPRGRGALARPHCASCRGAVSAPALRWSRP